MRINGYDSISISISSNVSISPSINASTDGLCSALCAADELGPAADSATAAAATCAHERADRIWDATRRRAGFVSLACVAARGAAMRRGARRLSRRAFARAAARRGRVGVAGRCWCRRRRQRLPARRERCRRHLTRDAADAAFWHRDERRGDERRERLLRRAQRRSSRSGLGRARARRRGPPSCAFLQERKRRPSHHARHLAACNTVHVSCPPYESLRPTLHLLARALL
mmetsp:Transcript_32808/g.72034  ORF Transcript_32808/g.72034 Transcript_32808/m.72034 type:complete len:229 (+) Transcript_32808:794-1480(+)